MADNLRDRIINAIWNDLIVQRDSDMPFTPSVSRSDSYIDGEVNIESLADAVIRELGLRPEYGHLDHQNSGRLYDTLKEAHTNQPLRGETLRTRLITDWADVYPG